MLLIILFLKYCHLPLTRGYTYFYVNVNISAQQKVLNDVCSVWKFENRNCHLNTANRFLFKTYSTISCHDIYYHKKATTRWIKSDRPLQESDCKHALISCIMVLLLHLANQVFLSTIYRYLKHISYLQQQYVISKHVMFACELVGCTL